MSQPLPLLNSGPVTRVAAGARPIKRGPAADAAFVEDAERHLEWARVGEMREENIVLAYRAALRAAGAIIAASRSRRRRLPAGSAWTRVRKLAPELSDWCDRFERHARFVNRVDMGVIGAVTAEQFDDVYRDACEFTDISRTVIGYGESVA